MDQALTRGGSRMIKAETGFVTCRKISDICIKHENLALKNVPVNLELDLLVYIPGQKNFGLGNLWALHVYMEWEE